MQPTLGLVPILITAGAAILPAILAGLASMAAVVLRPSELPGRIRQHPLGFAGVLALLILPFLVVPLFRKTYTSFRSDSAAQPDWAAVALQWQENQNSPTTLLAAEQSGTSTQSPRSLVYGGSLLRNGHLYAGGASESAPSPTQLQRLWRYPMLHTYALSSPILANQRVYAATCKVVSRTVTQGSLLCLDAATGSLVWELKTFSSDPNDRLRGFYSSPAITADGSRLLIGQGLHEDRQCKLLCVDTKRGDILWTVEVPTHVESSPMIEGDLVVVGVGAIEDQVTKELHGEPGYLLAVDVKTGETRWKAAITDPESSPALENGVAYVGSGYNGKAVKAFRTESDEALTAAGLDRLIWETPTDFPVVGSITLTDELVLTGCGNGDFVQRDPNPEGRIMALDKKTGEVVWALQTPDAVFGAVAVLGEEAVVPVSNGELYKLDVKTGEVIWATAIGGVRIGAGVIFTEEIIYVVATSGQLVLLNATDGALLESHSLNDRTFPGRHNLSISAPFLRYGLIVVGSETGGISCFGERP